MKTIEEFNTQRLQAQKIGPHHEELLRVMHADERVMATHGGVRSTEKNRRYMEYNFEHWKENGFGIWVFFEGPDRFVGRGGLLRINIEGVDEVELNYSVVAERWRQGFATEMANGSLGIAFGHLGLSTVVAFTLPTNTGSRGVMEKIGMNFERKFTLSGSTYVLYRMGREKFEEKSQ